EDVHPARTPDLFPGRPVALFGRLAGNARRGTVRVRGRIRNRNEEISIPVDLDAQGARPKALTSLWARAKIADLHDRMAVSPGDADLSREIERLALRYNLVCERTSFVAVDAMNRNASDHGTTVLGS